jgi:lipoprotein-anchoring transpeptidase ErfK/SrfK
MLRQGWLGVLIALSIFAWESEASAGESVKFKGYPKGSVVVKTKERRLYYIISAEKALRYPVAVGRPGRQWQGRTRVSRKIRNPVWAPPAAVRKDKPHLPKTVPPGLSNPLGVAVLILGNGTYGIHGTNNSTSIGKEASYGCIRMQNSDVLNLYAKVRVGTPVYVIK